MIDLKTIAQFVLLGNPSIHPVRAAAKTRLTGPKARRDISARHARRKRLARSGARLCVHAPKEPGQPTMGRQLVARHAVFHVVVLKEERRLSAEVQRLAARPDADERRAKPMRLLVVREVGGKIKRVVEAVRH